jgi:hypothetical protein
VLGRWTFFFNFKGHHLGFCKKHFAATWAQIIGNVRKNCEALQIVMKCCKLSSINSTGARECAAHHGMALEHFSANW